MQVALLGQLGLAEGAGEAEVRAAYLAGSKSYHPDRLAGVPPRVRALAEAKMAAINEAYHRLAAGGPAGGGPLRFRDADGPGSSRHGGGVAFRCRCWLCGQPGRVPADARPESCRCGSCHALLGLAFDPTTPWT